MLEKALSGNTRYWGWLGILGLFMAVAAGCYLYQLQQGLGVTGLSRDIPWGFYIAQFTFLVGVAASAVMVVMPYYLHNFKEFGKIAVLGEFVAIASIIMCLSFIFVDMGGSHRIFNAILHPTPNSMIFWDIVVLNGYLVLNVIITRVTFAAEKKGVAPPKWIKPVIYLSIPWAVSIHTVTAFLYAGLGARAFWMTAILAPRFLASAFSAGPALLILLCLFLRKTTKFDVGEKPIHKLAEIVTYAMAVNLFFVGLELFTSLYSSIPEHIHHFEYMFIGLEGHTGLVVWMWISMILGISGLTMLLIPKLRRNLKLLPVLCAMVIIALWIDKGMGMVITGFIPTPLGHVMDYTPTLVELLISLGIYSLGAFVLTVLYKIAVTVREYEMQ